MQIQLLLGQVLRFTGNPLVQNWQDTCDHIAQGAVAVQGSKILATGTAADLQHRYPGAAITDYGNDLILPGFVDAHVHYPQTAMIASWGKRLIDWLNTYTFPEETRLSDPDYANTIANRYCDLALAHGTTSFASFCTTAPASVDAIFSAAAARGMAVVAGKTCMDRNAPDTLIDTAARAFDESKALIEKWHGQGRATYAITPRFSPTSTPQQMDALGQLWAEYPDCLMQTHLSEQVEEIAWVRDLYPNAQNYLDTYAQHGLLGARGVYGHSIHLEPDEIAKLADTGAAVVHCPTSNMFIGSGLFDALGLARAGVNVGLATDIGGGSNFSMLHTMAAAYEVGQLRGDALHPAQLIWMATQGSARALHMHDQIGTLADGSAADLVVLNLASTPAIAQRVDNATGFWDALFPTIMMGDDRAIRQTWVNGQAVF